MPSVQNRKEQAMRINLLPLAFVSTFCCALPADGATHYVDLNSTNATPPFTDWATAATNIQNAVDAAAPGDLVLVTNGVYGTGVSTNGWVRVLVTNALTLQSVNGPAVTAIDGSNTVGCVELTDGAVLSGFTIRRGYVYGAGAGVNCASTNYLGEPSALVANCLVISNVSYVDVAGVAFAIVSNSILAENFSYNGSGAAVACTLYNSVITSNTAGASGRQAAGCFSSTLSNCLVFGNITRGNGVGGVSYSELDNCLVVSNSSYSGIGGAADTDLTNCTVCGNSGRVGGVGANQFYSTLQNSICYYNSSTMAGVSYSTNYDLFYTRITNSCTTPLANGAGNITNAPLFVNLAAGDFHLTSNSPCINAGNNAFVAGNTDYDGNPRIVGGTVDLGAYEYQSPSSILSYAWAQQYGLPTDGTSDFADPDRDGMNNWQEWIAGTNPTNALSVLKMLAPSNNVSGSTVSWQSVNTRTYFLQRSTNLAAPPAFSTLQSNLVGRAGTTVYTDTTATNGGSYFYRVGVQ
jgi:hypothetical protein